MALSYQPRILVLGDDAQSPCAVAQALAGCKATVWRSRSEIPPSEDVDVVIVLGGAFPQRASSENGELNPKVLVISDGPHEAADCVLPRDFTPRELWLVCKLLTEIHRVERECQRLVSSHRESRQLAETDPLTGLANRRVWDQEVQSRCRQATDGPTNGWLAIADLDHFKSVNEASGYTAGDRALVLAGQTLSAQLRRGDLLARLGGDEFGVLLSGLDKAQAHIVLQRLVSALAASPCDAGSLSVSIGYGPLTSEGSGAAFAAAERGLRAAKLAGGNCVAAGDLT